MVHDQQQNNNNNNNNSASMIEHLASFTHRKSLRQFWREYRVKSDVREYSISENEYAQVGGVCFYYPICEIYLITTNNNQQTITNNNKQTNK